MQKILRLDFNTSHVEVYLQKNFEQFLEFQNFNTSHVEVYQMGMAAYLTQDADFNTSHVEVYPSVAPDLALSSEYFNTSHVEVYLQKRWCKSFGTYISIHLMLKFIKQGELVRYNPLEFQYISC
mgnify:CR=1 FL=1